MTGWLYVAAGSAVGGTLRFWLADFLGKKWGELFLGTLAVNVSGSFAIGLLAALGPSAGTRQLLIVGLLGGYTTFSAFSLQTLDLIRAGRWPAVAANVLGSVALSLLAVWLGHLCGTALRRA
jgi:CrcB protein